MVRIGLLVEFAVYVDLLGLRGDGVGESGSLRLVLSEFVGDLQERVERLRSASLQLVDLGGCGARGRGGSGLCGCLSRNSAVLGGDRLIPRGEDSLCIPDGGSTSLSTLGSRLDQQKRARFSVFDD